MRRAALWLAPVLAVFWFACEQPAETAPSRLCDPGANIFCRCAGGDPGTKACADDGNSFGECEPCEPRPDSGPSSSASSSSVSSSSSSGAGGGNTGVGGAPTVTPGNGQLLSPCNGPSECQSGLCEQGFCTIACKLVSECPFPQSECVALDANNTLCVPSCATAVDCGPFGAPTSKCGYTKAVDNWGVTVCAYWGDNHALVPLETDCVPFDHPACNLGYQNRQRVCSEIGLCTDGCYVQQDCPDGSACTPGGGTLSTCQ